MPLTPLERLEWALVIYLMIAWWLLQVITWGWNFPDLPCAVIFDPEEWQAAWIGAKHSPPPQRPPTLRKMVRVIARFGGFLGRKSDGHPGPKAL